MYDYNDWPFDIICCDSFKLHPTLAFNGHIFTWHSLYARPLHDRMCKTTLSNVEKCRTLQGSNMGTPKRLLLYRGVFLLNRMHAIAVRYYQNLVIFLSMRHLPSWSRFSPFNCGGLAHTTRVTARKTIYSLRNNLPGSCPARIHDEDLSQHQGFPFKEICNTCVRFSWNTARNPLKW